jgi:hypothetical protein
MLAAHPSVIRTEKIMNGPGRNDQCSCRSGKKFKNCCLGKKVRTYGTLAKFRFEDIYKRNKDEPDGSITFHSETGRIIPIGVELRYGYVREKKEPKVIASFPVDPRNVRKIGNLHFLEYGRILAVDTNTKVIDGKSISVGTVSNGFVEINGSGEVKLTFNPEFIIEFWNAKKNAEILVWEFVVKNLARYPDRPRVAVVVDSFQQNLLELNLGDIPLYGKYFLPPNIRLLYASSDVGAEYFGNQMIRECDRVSGLILDKIKFMGENFENVCDPEDARYEAFRYWQIENNRPSGELSFNSYPPPPIARFGKYQPRNQSR